MPATAGEVHRQLITNVQVLRFIAAAMVLVKHAVEIFYPNGAAILVFPWNGGVDLFFVISGFIMARLTRGKFGNAREARRFLLRRVIRIIPPYWFFTALMVALLVVAPSAARFTRLETAPLLTSIAFIPWPRPADGIVVPLLSAGWTLNYEMFFYLCLGAALLVRRGKQLLVAGFCIVVALGALSAPSHFLLIFYTSSLLLEFLGGIALEQVYQTRLRLRWWQSLLCLAAAVIIYLLANSLPALAAYRGLVQGVPALLIAAAFILFPEPERENWIVSALRRGGDASYTLYLSHPFTANAVALVMVAVAPNLPWLGTLMAALASILVAMVFYRWVERPVTERLNRLADLGPSRPLQTVAP